MNTTATTATTARRIRRAAGGAAILLAALIPAGAAGAAQVGAGGYPDANRNGIVCRTTVPTVSFVDDLGNGQCPPGYSQFIVNQGLMCQKFYPLTWQQCVVLVTPAPGGGVR